MNLIIEKIETLPDGIIGVTEETSGLERLTERFCTTDEAKQLAREYRALMAVLEAADEVPRTLRFTPMKAAIEKARRVIEGGSNERIRS